MLRFKAESIRERDSDGRLLAAGVSWSTGRAWVWMLCILPAMFLVPGGLATVPGILFHSGYRLNWLLAFVACATGLWLVSRAFKRYGSGIMSVIFDADGVIPTPHGRPYAPRSRIIEGSHAHLVSIETRQSSPNPNAQIPLYDVCMFSSGGDVIHVAYGYPHESAHKMAVLLTAALSEMRQSQATLHARPKPQARAPRERALID